MFRFVETAWILRGFGSHCLFVFKAGLIALTVPKVKGRNPGAQPRLGFTGIGNKHGSVSNNAPGA